MGGVLTTFDMVIFFGSLLAVMAIGLWAGRKEETSEDYYLAGKGTKWWGVAGSIFGSNVSANHLVGMMGVGFAVGFAQSHFEITAICGLLALCYLFLPVYRKLNVYTLSEYLSRRYNDASRVAYAIIMVVIMVVIQMVPGFYIGSRSINILLQGDKGQPAAAQVVLGEGGAVGSVQIVNSGRMYGESVDVNVAPPPEDAADGRVAEVKAVIVDRPILAVVLKQGGAGYDKANPPSVTFGKADASAAAEAVAVVNDQGRVIAVRLVTAGSGYEKAPEVMIAPPPDGDDSKPALAFASVADRGVGRVEVIDGGAGYKAAPGIGFKGGSKDTPKLSPGDVDPTWYIVGILAMAIVTGTYTIVGGLKAVIVTDVIQSVLLLGAGILVALVTFNAFGGWGEMVARDSAMAAGEQRLHLYNPVNHPALPWTGVLSGLMVLHFYYWGSNQFIVQRALSAQSDRQARFGIISAGFFKLLIPFFSIGTGIAAWYYYADRAQVVAQDVVFIELLSDLIAPIGFGLVGLVAAGMFGAILSSLDSMMNSAATIFTFDIYKRYIDPEATEQRLIGVGRICIVVFISGAALLTILTMDPNSKDSFFLHIASHQGKLVAGVVVAFIVGMLWKRASGLGAFVAIVTGVGLSYGIEPAYAWMVANNQGFADVMVPTFGKSLNFFHAVFVAAGVSLLLHVLISLALPPREDQAKLTWAGLGIYKPETLKKGFGVFGVSIVIYAVLAVLMVTSALSPAVCGVIASVWTFAVFGVATARAKTDSDGNPAPALLARDGLWAGLLAALAIFMMYYFY